MSQVWPAFQEMPKIEIGTFMPKCVTPKLSISNIRTVGVRIYMTMTSRLRVRDFFVSTCLFRESLSTERKFKFWMFSWHWTCQNLLTLYKMTYHKLTHILFFFKNKSKLRRNWCTFLFLKYWRLSLPKKIYLLQF